MIFLQVEGSTEYVKNGSHDNTPTLRQWLEEKKITESQDHPYTFEMLLFMSQNDIPDLK